MKIHIERRRGERERRSRLQYCDQLAKEHEITNVMFLVCLRNSRISQKHIKSCGFTALEKIIYCISNIRSDNDRLYLILMMLINYDLYGLVHLLCVYIYGLNNLVSILFFNFDYIFSSMKKSQCYLFIGLVSERLATYFKNSSIKKLFIKKV